MRKQIGRKCLVAAVGVVIVPCLLAATPETKLDCEVHAGGTITARLSGLDVLTSFEGPLELEGSIDCGESSMPFLAEGSFRWVGVWNILTLISEVWVAFDAAGQSSMSDDVEIRGLLYTTRKSLVPLPKGVLLSGVHYTDVWIEGARRRYTGTISGIVDGGFEPADLPMTVQLTGTGVFHLTGDASPTEECGTPPPEIPLNHPILSQDFLQYLGRLLAWEEQCSDAD